MLAPRRAHDRVHHLPCPTVQPPASRVSTCVVVTSPVLRLNERLLVPFEVCAGAPAQKLGRAARSPRAIRCRGVGSRSDQHRLKGIDHVRDEGVHDGEVEKDRLSPVGERGLDVHGDDHGGLRSCGFTTKVAHRSPTTSGAA